MFLPDDGLRGDEQHPDGEPIILKLERAIWWRDENNAEVRHLLQGVYQKENGCWKFNGNCIEGREQFDKLEELNLERNRT